MKMSHVICAVSASVAAQARMIFTSVFPAVGPSMPTRHAIVGKHFATASNDIPTAANSGSQDEYYEEAHGSRQEADEDNCSMIVGTSAVDSNPSVTITTAIPVPGKVRPVARPVPGWLPTAKIQCRFHAKHCCNEGGVTATSHILT